MYKALAFKELRETAWIAGLMLVAMVLVVLDQIGGVVDPARLTSFGMLPVDPFGPRKIPFVHPSLANHLAWVAGVGALALGFRQSLGESLRGTWIFLLHRPASRDAILLTKLSLGVGLLLAATVIPLMCLAGWAALPGTHASPFDWRMTQQPLRLCFAATALYLAAFMTGFRVARWHGSRLLPLPLAALAFAWVMAIVWWPAIGWLIVMAVDLAYLVAILAVSRTREFP